MIAVLQFPGSNDDRDMRFAWKSVLGARAELVWHKESSLPADTRAVMLPGGFSYGDDLGAGLSGLPENHLEEVVLTLDERVDGAIHVPRTLVEAELRPAGLRLARRLQRFLHLLGR